MQFAMDMSKVSFALSHLQGVALSWFKLELLDLDDNNPPHWYVDYNQFMEVLSKTFGLFDAVTDMENELRQLWMCKEHHVNWFLVDFQHLASQVRWGDSALHYQFYQARPPSENLTPLPDSKIWH